MAALSFVVKAVDEATNVLRGIGDEAEGLGGKLSKIGDLAGSGFDALGKASLAAGAGFAGLAAAGLKLGADLDSVYDTIRLGTGATGQDLDNLISSFKRVAAQSPADMAVVGQAIADLNTRMGLTGQPLEQLTNQFVDLGRIAGADVPSLIREGTRVFADFGIGADQAGSTLDMLWRVSQATGVGVTELMQQMQQSGATMRAMGLDATASATLLGLMEKSGVDVAAAMTGLNKAVAAAAKDGKPAQQAIADLFDSIKTAKDPTEAMGIAVEIFGAKAGPKLADAIRSGRLSYSELLEQIQNGEETISSAAADTDGWQESLARLKNQAIIAISPLLDRLVGLVDRVAAGIGPLAERVVPQLQTAWEAIRPSLDQVGNTFRDVIVPSAERLAGAVRDALQPALDAIGGWLREHGSQLTGPFAAAIGGVLVVGLTAAAVAAGSFAASMLLAAAPIVAVVAAVAAVSAGIYLLITHWDDLKARFPILQELEDTFRRVAGQVGAIIGEMGDLLMAIVDRVRDVISKVREHWGTITDIMRGPVQVVAALVEGAFNQVRIIIETALGVIRGVIQTVTALIKGDWQGAWDGIKQVGETVWNGIKALVQNGIDTIKGIFEGVVTFFGEIGPRIWGAAKSIWETVKTDGWQLMQEMGQKIIDVFTALPGKLLDLVPKLLDAGKALMGAIFDGLKSAASAVGGFAADIAETVGRAIKSFVNEFVIDRLNRALEFTIPNPLGKDIHIDPPDIPRLASGGIITRAGLALVGESGPELVLMPAGAAVLPNAIAAAVAGAVRGAGGPQVTVQVLGPVTISGEQDTERFASDLGHGLAASLRARGVM